MAKLVVVVEVVPTRLPSERRNETEVQTLRHTERESGNLWESWRNVFSVSPTASFVQKHCETDLLIFLAQLQILLTRPKKLFSSSFLDANFTFRHNGDKPGIKKQGLSSRQGLIRILYFVCEFGLVVVIYISPGKVCSTPEKYKATFLFIFSKIKSWKLTR